MTLLRLSFYCSTRLRASHSGSDLQMHCHCLCHIKPFPPRRLLRFGLHLSFIYIKVAFSPWGVGEGWGIGEGAWEFKFLGHKTFAGILFWCGNSSCCHWCYLADHKTVLYKAGGNFQMGLEGAVEGGCWVRAFGVMTSFELKWKGRQECLLLKS